MTRVDFYVIPSADPSARLQVICRLAEKVWRQGMHIYLHCTDEAQRSELDGRLWSFRDEAFIPHSLVEEDTEVPVVPGLSEPPGNHRNLLINLALEAPGFVLNFSRVAEPVVEEPAIRQATRDKFRFYREQGYPLQDHRLPRIWSARPWTATNRHNPRNSYSMIWSQSTTCPTNGTSRSC